MGHGSISLLKNGLDKWQLPPTKPTPRPSFGYCGFILYYTLGHVGGGNSCGRHTMMRVATTHAG